MSVPLTPVVFPGPGPHAPSRQQRSARVSWVSCALCFSTAPPLVTGGNLILFLLEMFSFSSVTKGKGEPKGKLASG